MRAVFWDATGRLRANLPRGERCTAEKVIEAQTFRGDDGLLATSGDGTCTFSATSSEWDRMPQPEDAKALSHDRRQRSRFSHGRRVLRAREGLELREVGSEIDVEQIDPRVRGRRSASDRSEIDSDEQALSQRSADVEVPR